MGRKFTIDTEKLTKLVKQGKTDSEISIELNCSYSTIGKYRRLLGLKANVRRVGKKILIDRDKLIDLTNQGKTNQELAKLFNVSPLSIKQAIKRFGLEIQDDRINKICNLSHKQEEVIFGSTLGDAYIQIQQKNASINIQHSYKQKEYVDYLTQIFQNIPE